MKKLLVMLLLAMSAVVFTVGCGDDRPEHILTVKQLEELLETKTAAQIFEENLINKNQRSRNDPFCIDAAGLSFLLENGLDVNAKSEAGFTVLHVAAYWGDLDLVKELIGKGQIQLYSDSIRFDLNNGGMMLPIEDVLGITLIGNKIMDIYIGDVTYRIKGNHETNLIKYMHTYYIIQNRAKGIENGLVGI